MSKRPVQQGNVRHFDAWPVLANLTLALLYVLFGRFALLQAVPPGYATLIFFPAGIAFAAVITYGPRLLPGVALGAVLLNLGMGAHDGGLTAVKVAAAVIVGAASTLQVLVGTRLFQRWCTTSLATGKEVLSFLIIIPATCLVASSVSVVSLYLMHVVHADSMLSNWIFWWAGDTIGVMVAAPLSWLAIGTPLRLWKRRRWLLALPLCICSLAFIFMYTKVSALEQQQQQHQFVLNAQQVSDVFQYQFSEHERLLYAMGSLFYQSQITTPENFARMARSYLDNRPELRLISWAPYVTRTQRPEFERWAQSTITSDFTVRQLSDGKISASHERERYFVTSYIEPLAGNERVLGLDMLSEPVRAAMVRNAMAGRRPTASEPIALVQEQHKQAGVLLAQMVYPSHAAPDGMPAGMLVAVLQVEQYVKLALAQPAFSGLEIKLEDITSPSHPNLMFNSIEHSKEFEQVKRPLALGGRNYQITVAPSEAYTRAHQGWQSWGALGSGMALTGLLGAFLLLISAQREQIEGLVIERTRELHEREARLKAILDEAADAILTVGRNGRLVSANAASERLFGYPGTRMAAMSFETLVPCGEAGASKLLEDLARHLRASPGAEGGDDMFGRRADGAAFPVAMAASLVELPEESFFVCIVHDLSEERRAQQKILALEALKQTQNDLVMAEKMASLGSLVAGIAHELNTPIGNSLLAATALAGRVNQFQETLNESGVRRSELQDHLNESSHACEMISGSLHRVADLISTFKQVAVDQTIDQRRSFDLKAVCASTLATHATALRRANCELSWSMPEGLIMHSYAGSLSQVLNSLVNNALLHAFNGRASGSIRVSARALDLESVELVFKDDGIGMPPEILRRVFDPFFTTKLGQGSSGLGMNIVYNLVTGMLGGRIVLESEPGQGTSAIITMPLKSAARSAGASEVSNIGDSVEMDVDKMR
ncbi:MAG: CHASE domain-containing protein [Pseudomonadota bacterium]